MEDAIGERLRRLRQERGWTQNVLGYHAGRAPSVISQVETGKREPELSTVKALAGALGVDWRFLLLGDEFPKAEAPNANASPGLHDPGLVPENPEHAAKLMRAATEIAELLPAEWNREVEEYADAGQSLPRFRTLEMQSTAIRLNQIFSSAFAFMQRDAIAQGRSQDPTTWSARMQEGLVHNLAALQALSELIRRIEAGTQLGEDARALRAEFGPVPNEELGRMTKDPAYSKALTSAREMAGVA